MKNVLTLIYLIVCLPSFSQTIFDFKIEQLYIDEGKLLFLNKGEKHYYFCEPYDAQLNDYEYSINLECIDRHKLPEDVSLLPFEELIPFSDPEALIKSINNTRFDFVAKSSERSSKRYSFQLLNDHLFVSTESGKYGDSDNWNTRATGFWDYCFFRINGEYLILALVDDEAYVWGYVIPTKDGGFVLCDKKFQAAGIKDDTTDFAAQIETRAFYRIKQIDNKVRLFDRTFDEDLLEQSFDEIRITDNFILGIRDAETVIYDKALKKLAIPNVKAAFETFGSIQVIQENQIKWYSRKGVAHDTFPIPQYLVCGNTTSINRKITYNEDGFYEVRTKDSGYLDTVTDTTFLLKGMSATEVMYLNADLTHAYDEYADLTKVFEFPLDYYAFKNGKTSGIIEIKNVRDSISRTLLFQRNYSKGVNKDSIDAKIAGLKSQVKTTILLEDHFDSLQLFGYYHPILFKKERLYGYFPVNEIAKYSKLEPYNFHFAKFELPNGKTGWIDLSGNEYYEDD